MATTLEVESYLQEQGLRVIRLDEPTPTCETAAQALGCSVAEIAKTILFIVGDKPVVIVAPGDRRVKGSLLKKALGWSGKARLPGGDEVTAATGYKPGGVCPFLLPEGVAVVIDSGLMRFDTVYPAAGDDHSGVPVSPGELARLTGGIAATVCG